MLLLLLALTTPPDAALPPGPAIPPARDCALYDLIHREQLSRRADTDDGIQLRVSPGTGVAAHLVCPGWRITGPAPSEIVVFEPPVWSRRGVSACVDFSVLHFNHHWDTRRVTGRSMHRCELRRQGTAWRLKACRQIAGDR